MSGACDVTRDTNEHLPKVTTTLRFEVHPPNAAVQEIASDPDMVDEFIFVQWYNYLSFWCTFYEHNLCRCIAHMHIVGAVHRLEQVGVLKSSALGRQIPTHRRQVVRQRGDVVAAPPGLQGRLVPDGGRLGGASNCPSPAF